MLKVSSLLLVTSFSLQPATAVVTIPCQPSSTSTSAQRRRPPNLDVREKNGIFLERSDPESEGHHAPAADDSDVLSTAGSDALKEDVADQHHHQPKSPDGNAFLKTFFQEKEILTSIKHSSTSKDKIFAEPPPSGGAEVQQGNSSSSTSSAKDAMAVYRNWRRGWMRRNAERTMQV